MNLEDIARLADVSRSTVSRVINDDPRVSAPVRERVKRVIALHNFHPNAAARTLASRRTQVVGLLIPEIAARVFTDPWYPVLIQGSMDGCQDQDLSLMLLMESSSDPAAADRLIQRTIRANHLDGLVIATSLANAEEMGVIAGHDFPYVVVGRTPALNATWVDVDNRAAAATATAHLLGHDRTRPVMLAGPPSIVASVDRADGFRDAVFEAGLTGDVHYTPYDQRAAYDSALRLLDVDDPPDAIFAASDVMAIGVLQAARSLGISVPEQLGLIGFDDIQPDRVSQLGISSVRQPTRDMGRRTIELLNARIANPTHPHVHEWFPTELVLRTSCGCPPSESAVATAAGATGVRHRMRGDPLPASAF